MSVPNIVYTENISIVGITAIFCVSIIISVSPQTLRSTWYTPSNSEIICVQNVGAKVEMVSYLKK